MEISLHVGVISLHLVVVLSTLKAEGGLSSTACWKPADKNVSQRGRNYIH